MGGSLARARDQERQFLLSVSHELRTPLTSIRGYADAVLDGATDDPHGAPPPSSAPRPGGWSASSRTCSTWPASTPTASRFDLRAVDAARWSARWSSGFRAPGGRTGHRARPGPGFRRPARCRPTATGSARSLANLVENAASFAARRVEVGLAGGSGGAVLWVDDDGPGIPADQLTRVFDRHFTTDRDSGQPDGLRPGTGHRRRAGRRHGRPGACRVAGRPDGTGTRMVVRLQPPPQDAAVATPAVIPDPGT